MYQFLPALPDAACASIFLIPFLIHHRKQQESAFSMVLVILFALYLSAVYAIAGLPSVVYIRFHPKINITPFLYMFSDHTASLLNVLLFIPLGFCLPILWKQFRNGFRTLLWGLSISAAIEFLQLFAYRATDVNDLITNTFGTFCGYLVGMLMLKLFPTIPSDQCTKSPYTILAAVFCIMFFVQPVFLWIFLHGI